MKPIDQIIEELQQIGIDIPEYIQSGKPENVKAANHRSLETRMNNAILDLVEHIKNLDGDRNVIVGEDDPNTTPPIGAIVGSLYLQKNAAGDNLALYINTGTAEVGWFLFREYTEESKIYGDAPNPNFDSIPGKVGDLYIQTNNGTSTGDILSVWMYIGLAIGDLWFNISAPSGSFNITTKTLTDGQVYNFPSMAKGEAFIVKIIDENTIPAPSGAVWLGGYGGVLAGDGTLVICLTNSPGGSFADVGHQFVIINQGKDSEVLFVDELPDENLARTGVIYVLNSNNAMYVWDQQLGDYVLVGDVIPGTLISSTVFEDENNNVVVPEANKLYFDTTTEIYYRWNGSEYVLLNQSDNEIIFSMQEPAQGVENKLYINLSSGTMKVWHNGGWIDLTFNISHLSNQKYIKYNEVSEQLESGLTTESQSGISVDGNIKGKGFIGRSVTASVGGSYVIDFADMAEHYILQMTDNTSIMFDNMITEDETVVITLTVTGNYSLLLPSFLVASFENDDYDGSMNNEIVINIKRGGANPLGYYTLKSYEI